jgi:hypothetical protein
MSPSSENHAKAVDLEKCGANVPDVSQEVKGLETRGSMSVISI